MTAALGRTEQELREGLAKKRRPNPLQYQRMPAHRARFFYSFLALFVIALDRLSKRAVAARIALYAHIQVIPGLFRLTHTENTGAAFSLLAASPAHWKTVLLIAFSVIAMLVVIALLWKQPRLTLTGIALSLILGGAAGNLWDRVARGLSMPGVALLRRFITIGRAIDEIEFIADVADPEDLKDRVIYLPL